MSWWRDTPLADWETELLNAATAAHYSNTFRANQSAVAVQLAASGSGNFYQAIAMATLTLGGQHAPLLDVYAMLDSENPALEARKRLVAGKRVPGWGNAFHKDCIDPAWDGVVSMLEKQPVWERVTAIQEVLDSYNKKLFPNPGCLSACIAITVGLPKHLAPWVGVMGRMTGWAQLFARAYKEPM